MTEEESRFRQIKNAAIKAREFGGANLKAKVIKATKDSYTKDELSKEKRTFVEYYSGQLRDILQSKGIASQDQVKSDLFTNEERERIEEYQGYIKHVLTRGVLPPEIAWGQKDLKNKKDTARVYIGPLFKGFFNTIPAEVGPHLMLNDPNQPEGKPLFIGMKQISDPNDIPSIFRLGLERSGLWLDCRWTGHRDSWSSNSFFVFSLPQS